MPQLHLSLPNPSFRKRLILECPDHQPAIDRNIPERPTRFKRIVPQPQIRTCKFSHPALP